MNGDELIEGLDKLQKDLTKVSKITAGFAAITVYVAIPLSKWLFSSKKSSSGPRRRSSKKNFGA